MRKLNIDVINISGSTLNAGTVVYITGYSTSFGLYTIDYASADDLQRTPAVGILLETTDNNQVGRVQEAGPFSGIDTSSYPANTPVYLGFNGAISFINPILSSSSNFVQQIGIVGFSSTNGTLLLQESFSAGQSTAGGDGYIIGAGIPNALAYWGDASILTSNVDLYWNNTDGYLGVGTPNPKSTLFVSNSTENDAYGTIYFQNTGSIDGYDASIFGANIYSTGQLKIWNNLGVRVGVKNYNNSLGNLYLTAGNDVSVATLTPTGRMGIGTDLPGGLLGLGNAGVYITNDGSNNMVFADANVGIVTLSDLVNTIGGYITGEGIDGYLPYYVDGYKVASSGLAWDAYETTIDAYGNIIPIIDNTYTLGNANLRWKSINVGPGSIHLNSLASETGNVQDWKLAINTSDSLGTFYLSNNNTNTLVVNTSGQVGIGSSVIPNSTLTIDGYISLQNQLSTPNPSNGYGFIYVNDADGYLYYISSLTSPQQIATSANSILGTGTTNQVGYFSGPNMISGSSDFTFDGTNLTVANDAYANSFVVDSYGNATKPAFMISDGYTAGIYYDTTNNGLAFAVNGNEVFYTASLTTIQGSGPAIVLNGSNFADGASPFLIFGSPTSIGGVGLEMYNSGGLGNALWTRLGDDSSAAPFVASHFYTAASSAANNPAIQLTASTLFQTGFYYGSPGIGFTVDGYSVGTWTSTALTSDTKLLLTSTNGIFFNSTSTGIQWLSGNNLRTVGSSTHGYSSLFAGQTVVNDGPLQVANYTGTLSSPAIQLGGTGANNTGINAPTSSSLQLITAGVLALSIDSSQNVTFSTDAYANSFVATTFNATGNIGHAYQIDGYDAIVSDGVSNYIYAHNNSTGTIYVQGLSSSYASFGPNYSRIFPNGSASQPSLYIGTGNEGIYASAPQHLSFATNGIQALDIDANQDAYFSTTSAVGWTNRAILSSSADGQILVSHQNGTGINGTAIFFGVNNSASAPVLVAQASPPGLVAQAATGSNTAYLASNQIVASQLGAPTGTSSVQGGPAFALGNGTNTPKNGFGFADANHANIYTNGISALSIDSSQDAYFATNSTVGWTNSTELVGNVANGLLQITNSTNSAPTTLSSGILIGNGTTGNSLVYDSTYGLRSMNATRTNNTGFAGVAFRLTNTDGSLSIGSVSDGFGFTSGHSILVSTNLTVALTIDSSQNATFSKNIYVDGYIGVGTVTPQNNIDVFGNVSIGGIPFSPNLLTYNEATAGDNGTHAEWQFIGNINLYGMPGTNPPSGSPALANVTSVPWGAVFQGTDALHFTDTSGNYQDAPSLFVSCQPSTQYTFSLEYGDIFGGNVQIAMYDNTGAGNAHGYSVVANQWNKLQVTYTTQPGANTLQLALSWATRGGTEDWYMDALQLEVASSATTWQSPTSSSYIAPTDGLSVVGESIFRSNVGILNTNPQSALSINGVVSLSEQSSDPTLISGYGQVYTKSDGYLYYENPAGTVYQITSAAGDVFGSGSSGEVTYWNSSNTLTGNSAFTFDGTNLTLTNDGYANNFIVSPNTGTVQWASSTTLSSPANGTLEVKSASSATVASLILANNTSGQGLKLSMTAAGGHAQVTTDTGGSIVLNAFSYNATTSGSGSGFSASSTGGAAYNFAGAGISGMGMGAVDTTHLGLYISGSPALTFDINKNATFSNTINVTNDAYANAFVADSYGTVNAPAFMINDGYTAGIYYDTINNGLAIAVDGYEAGYWNINPTTSSTVLQLPTTAQINFGTITNPTFPNVTRAPGQAILIGPLDPVTVSLKAAGQYNFGSTAIAIGRGAAIYTQANDTDDNNIVIGSQATVFTNVGTLFNNISSGHAFRNLVIGHELAAVQGYRSIAIGNEAFAAGASNIAIGDLAIAGGNEGAGGVQGVGIKPIPVAEVQKSTVIGCNAFSDGYSFATALGYSATNSANNQIMLGTSAETVAHPGGVTFAQKTITATTYSLAISDYIIFADATSNAITLTLPDATLPANLGRVYKVKRLDGTANNIAINTTASQTIDGALTYSIAAQYDSITLVNNGSNWFLI